MSSKPVHFLICEAGGTGIEPATCGFGKQSRPGRPRQCTLPDRTEWQIQATITVVREAVTRAVQRKAAFSGLKDRLFLASSVFVKQPERIVALSLIMVLCLLVYWLAEHRLRERLAATGQTVPSHLQQPTAQPAMRWMFQCFEGISLVRFLPAHGPPHHEIAGLKPLHHQVIRLLGPHCEQLYELGV